MTIDRDTFLTTVYVLVDTAVAHQPPRPRHGRPPRMSDSEIVTLMLVGQFLGGSERHLLRWADAYLRPYFPGLISQSSFNRRSRTLAIRCAWLMQQVLAQLPLETDPFEIVDGLAVPVAHLARSHRRATFAASEADLGYGGVGKQPYYGVQVVLCVTASGPITGFVLAPARTEERWLFSQLLRWRCDPGLPLLTGDVLTHQVSRSRRRTFTGPTGPILGPMTAGTSRTNVYLADQGFTGVAWQQLWHDAQATVCTQDHLPPSSRRLFRRARQVVETVNGQLVDVFGIRYPKAHTQDGLVTRIVAKCAALNVGIVLNRTYQRPALALGTLFDG
jgi:hypothetical protein